MVTTHNRGSFRALREQHLPLFDGKLHRHDRGWPHPVPEARETRPAKRLWKTAGIFHFRHEEQDES